MIKTYINKQDWRVKENSNANYSYAGLQGHIANTEVAKYVLENIYPKEIADAHRDCYIHIHDLGNGIIGYCAGWSLMDLIKEGFNCDVRFIHSKPASHLSSILGQMENFIFTLSQEWAGAMAFNSVDTLLAPFVRNDGLTYPEVKQEIQQHVFNLNNKYRIQFQTPFSNYSFDLISPEDLRNWSVIIGGEEQDFTYGECQKEMNMINKAFMEVLMEGDGLGKPFSFPIPTYSITQDFNWDNKLAQILFEMTGKTGAPYFSNFINSSLKPSDVRSMCPLDGKEKVLIRSTRGRELEYVEIGNLGNHGIEEYEVFADGKFVKGKFIKVSNQEMIEVTLINGHKIKMSKEHLNYIQYKNNKETKIVKAKDLTDDMYLPYSLKKYNGSGGFYELGYLVGCYAGDGSIDNDTAVVYSLNKSQKDNVAKKIIQICEKYFGATHTLIPDRRTGLLTLRINSKAVVGLCKEFVKNMGRNKHYAAKIFNMSSDFRKGVIEGHLNTDGGNRNRIYTSSIKMVESINMLCATLGTTTSIYKDRREGRLGKEPNYAVLIYQLNRDNYGDIWFKKDNKLWVKIKEVKVLKNKKDAYCFEVKNDEPMFTVGTTGILTHNCRLRLDLRELIKNSSGLFGSGDKTGSVGVVTINLSRLGYLNKNNSKSFFKMLNKYLIISKESLLIKRQEVLKNMENGLLPYTKRYLGHLNNHFNTIGIIGANECTLNMFGYGIETKQGRQFVLDIQNYILSRLADFQEETGLLFNLEATPAEGVTHRFAKHDLEEFNDIITANSKQLPYYTNSTMLPVEYSENIWEVLDHQDELQCKYTSGTVLHIFLNEPVYNYKVIRSLIKKIFTKYKLPYISITPTITICPIHGRLDKTYEFCPYEHTEEEISIAKQRGAVIVEYHQEN